MNKFFRNTSYVFYLHTMFDDRTLNVLIGSKVQSLRVLRVGTPLGLHPGDRWRAVRRQGVQGPPARPAAGLVSVKRGAGTRPVHSLQRLFWIRDQLQWRNSRNSFVSALFKKGYVVLRY